MMDKKEQARLRMQRMRNKQRNTTNEDVTQSSDNVTQEMVAPLGTLPARPRYLDLGDGQILDRANPPKRTKELYGMEASNRADRTIINQEKADRHKRWKEGNHLLEAVTTSGYNKPL